LSHDRKRVASYADNSTASPGQAENNTFGVWLLTQEVSRGTGTGLHKMIRPVLVFTVLCYITEMSYIRMQLHC